MYQKHTLLILLLALLLILPNSGKSQVLGACGGGEKAVKAKVEVNEEVVEQKNLVVQPVPLPGQPAIDFELPAVVGNEIKTVKLSDYKGMWRVVCFYPADFTFV